MLQLLSDLSKCLTVDVELSGSALTHVKANGKQGMFVKPDGGASASGVMCLAIWNESNRDDTVGESGKLDQFSPDVAKTSKITLLAGTYRAKTSFVENDTFAAGTPLVVDDGGTGFLKPWDETGGDDHIIGYALGPVETSYSYLGKTYSYVLEYITV